MHTFQLVMREMCTFHFEMHKTVDFHSKLSVSWELGTKGCQERPIKWDLVGLSLERPYLMQG